MDIMNQTKQRDRGNRKGKETKGMRISDLEQHNRGRLGDDGLVRLRIGRASGLAAAAAGLRARVRSGSAGLRENAWPEAVADPCSRPDPGVFFSSCSQTSNPARESRVACVGGGRVCGMRVRLKPGIKLLRSAVGRGVCFIRP